MEEGSEVTYTLKSKDGGSSEGTAIFVKVEDGDYYKAVDVTTEVEFIYKPNSKNIYDGGTLTVVFPNAVENAEHILSGNFYTFTYVTKVDPTSYQFNEISEKGDITWFRYENRATIHYNNTGKVTSDYNYVGISRLVLGKSVSYDFDKNQTLPDDEKVISWTIEVNKKGYYLYDLVVTDVIPEGLSLVNDSVKLQIGTNMIKNFVYEYDESTRTLTVKLDSLAEQIGPYGRYARIYFDTTIDDSEVFTKDEPTTFSNTVYLDHAGYDGEITATAEIEIGNTVIEKSYFNKIDNNGEASVEWQVLINEYNIELNNIKLTDELMDGLVLDTNSFVLKELVRKNGEFVERNVIPQINDDGAVNYEIIYDFSTNTFTFEFKFDTGLKAYQLTFKTYVTTNAQVSNTITLTANGTVEEASSAEIPAKFNYYKASTSARLATLLIQKLNENGEILTGAKFALYDKNGNLVLDSIEVDENGQIIIANRLLYNSKYYLVETEYPAGYADEIGFYNTTIHGLPAYEFVIKAGEVVEDETTGYKVYTIGVLNYPLAVSEPITIEKIWEDENNRDGLRPKSIEVALIRNGVNDDTIVLNEENNWTYTWYNLPGESDEKIPYEYEVQEVTYVEGYSPAYSYDEERPGVTMITNTHEIKTTSKTVNKVWKPYNDETVIPREITVQLYADTEIYGEEITLSEETGWTYTWEELPLFDNGVEITYTVGETSVVEDFETNYFVEEDGSTTIINSENRPIATPVVISVEKVWKDENNRDGLRPTSILVVLTRNGLPVDKIELNEENNWTYTWEDLPAESDERKTYEYVVIEATEVEGYSRTYSYDEARPEVTIITNIHEVETTSMTVNKVWKPYNDETVIPREITVQLYAGTEIYGEEITLSEETGWTYTWENLLVNDNGEEISYTVLETSVHEDFEVEYVIEEDGDIAIINYENRPITAPVTISVEKIWEDDNNRDGLRPTSIEVALIRNGVITDTIELNEGNNWTYTWEDLPAESDERKAYAYVVAEISEVEGYSTTYNFDEERPEVTIITNTHEIETTSMTVNKVWETVNDDTELPTEITVQLYTKGAIYGEEITLSEENNWTYTWEQLPVNDNGAALIYTVLETWVHVDFKTDYVEDEDGSITIINRETWVMGDEVEVEVEEKPGGWVLGDSVNTGDYVIYGPYIASGIASMIFALLIVILIKKNYQKVLD